MKKLFLTLGVVCTLGTAADSPRTAPQAQQPADTTPIPSSDTRITLEVNRVNMLFTVSDKKGRFVTNLGKDDFEVLEEKRPQEIVEFAAESELPLRLAVLID